MHHPRVLIIGAGRLARAVARSIPDHITAVLARSAESAAAMTSAAAGVRVLRHLDELSDVECDAVWILVPDRDIAEVASELAAARGAWTPCLGIHSSGAGTRRALLPLANPGCVTTVLHPNGTFSGDAPIPGGLLWTVSPDLAPETRRNIEALLSPVHPRLLELSDEMRPMYHAAATLASNYVVTLMKMAHDMYVDCGIPLADAGALVDTYVRQAAENTRRLGPLAALTGPVVRGDNEVVNMEIAVVGQRFPTYGAVLELLARVTARIARDRSDVREREGG